MNHRATSAVPWLEPLAASLRRDGAAVLVVVAATQGSAPRDAGTVMVVSTSACQGTIGGGHLEFEATRIARDAVANRGDSGWIVRFPLAARLGQCCGGVATLAFLALDTDASDWIDCASACARTGAPFVVVTPVERGAGVLLVTPDDTRGSLGDPMLDSAAIALARARLAGTAEGSALVRCTGDDGPTLLIHVERPDPFPVLLFGNGHVGRALVDVLGVLPAQVRWFDAREGDFPAHIPANVDVVVTDAPDDELRAAPHGAFVVVATHSHALDLVLIETALARDDWRYVGLIGSKSKRAQFERRLAERGHAPGALARIRCPIGANGVSIRAKHPGAIAVAIAAELLMVRETGARLPALRVAAR